MSATPRILVTGGAGQLGIELARAAWATGTEILTPTRAELDIADAESVAAFFAAGAIDVVINSAAYTAVDRAETEISAAWLANAVAPALLAAASAAAAIPMLQISTDYVFDGSKVNAYQEDDPVAPLGVYGSSKLAGEIAVRSGNPRSVILRTAWVVSAHRANFVKTMLRLGEARPELRVVGDQLGCPTGAADIAAAIVAITERLLADPAAPTGVYHFVNDGAGSWYDLARTIFAISGPRGGPAPAVTAITTAEYPTPARRPANSRLSTDRLRADYGIIPRPWQQSVRDIVEQLVPQRTDQKEVDQ